MGAEPYARGISVFVTRLPFVDALIWQPYLFYDEKTPYDVARAANETSRYAMNYLTKMICVLT